MHLHKLHSQAPGMYTNGAKCTKIDPQHLKEYMLKSWPRLHRCCASQATSPCRLSHGMGGSSSLRGCESVRRWVSSAAVLDPECISMQRQSGKDPHL